jgi:Fur family transcriptional regulator, ferric uptake regulator
MDPSYEEQLESLEELARLVPPDDPFAKSQRAWIARERAELVNAARVRNARVKRRERANARDRAHAQPHRRPDGAESEWALGADAQAWARQARSLLRRVGHKRGAAREALIKLFAGQECALSVPEVEEKLEQRRPVARASIYRALEVLSDLDLLVRVDAGDGVARYERAHDADGDHHHHHMICDSCGLLIPFDDEQLELAIHGLSDRLGFDAKGHEVTLRGVCQECKDGAPD